MTRRTLIVSEYNAKDRAHFALSHEFCRIVSECEDADVIAPGVDEYLHRRIGKFLPEHDGHNVQRDFNRLVGGMRKSLKLMNAPTIEPVTLNDTYDLFLFVAWSPQSLVELQRVRNWRQRCKTAVVYLFELWSSTLEQDSAYLKLLDQFDHVFLLHSACIRHLPAYTRTPCSPMVAGVDCLVSTPFPSPPKRVIDVYSYGNRSMQVHRQLVKLSEKRDFFYVYDSLSSTDSRVKDWREHRLLLANIIKRSRYFIAFSPASLASGKERKVAGEQVLPSRLFEGAAGGAVILGTAPQCQEFAECFDWPDAVIEVAPDGSDIVNTIHELDAQPVRLERLRRTNAVRSLLQHDWAYRWEHVLATVGMDPLPQLTRRKSRLRELASLVSALESA